MQLYRIVSGALHPFTPVVLKDEGLERDLEELLWQSGPQLDILWLGRHPLTAHQGYPDLVGIGRDGSLQIWEIKRDRAPREMMAQAFEYGAWAATLKPEDLEALAQGQHRDGSWSGLRARFAEFFGMEVALPDGDAQDFFVPRSVKLVLLAADFDVAVKDQVRWLQGRGFDIEMRCFALGRTEAGEELLSMSEASASSVTLRRADEGMDRRITRSPPSPGALEVVVGETPLRGSTRRELLLEVIRFIVREGHLQQLLSRKGGTVACRQQAHEPKDGPSSAQWEKLPMGDALPLWWNKHGSRDVAVKDAERLLRACGFLV